MFARSLPLPNNPNHALDLWLQTAQFSICVIFCVKLLTYVTYFYYLFTKESGDWVVVDIY